MNAQKYLDTLYQIKSLTFATVDETGKPRVRIINVMLVEDEKLYFVTARGKSFYRELEARGEAALIGMTAEKQAIRLNGRVKKLDQSWVDRIFAANPNMARLYQGDSRYILDAFCIDEGEGESFELNAHPPLRETFSVGGASIPERGFVITKDCTQCGTCAEVCPEKCVSAGSTDAEPYRIDQGHCIRCGLCFERCPAEAVEDRG